MKGMTIRMKRISIIGAGVFQIPLIQRAKALGYETHVFAWSDGAVGKKDADYFYPISITEKELILKKCQEIKPVAVVSVASDLAVLTVNYVSRALGLPCNPAETDLWATNKFSMRQAFRKYGVKTPGFVKVNETFSEKDLGGLKFPLIVKPTDRSGSRAICKVRNYAEASVAVKNALSESFEKSAIIEEEILGNEYSCECISQNGTHHILTFTKKYTTNEPDYIERAHLESSNIIVSNLEFIKEEIIKGLDALHITTGASHTEFRIDEHGEVKIIEIGARMGGDCIGTHLVPLSTGYDFIGMIIDAACGNPINQFCWEKSKVSYIRFVMEENDLRLLRRIQSDAPECIHYISDFDEIGGRKIVDSSTRFGFFILQCDSMDMMTQLIGEKL